MTESHEFISEVKMGVICRRPHTLWILCHFDGYEDDDGHFHKGTDKWVEYMRCDVVPSSVSANIITYDDGRTSTYEYTVYLSPICRDFQVGERVRLTRFCEETETFKVKGFQRYQHQCKLLIGHDGN